MDSSKQNLNQVTNSIDKTLGILNHLHLTITSSYDVIPDLVVELDNMAELGEKCHVQVPMDVINLIDDGKNPDEFTREVLNSYIAKNQITKGKTDAFKGLRGHLLEEVEQAFPHEVKAYRIMKRLF